jgi:ABC-type glycerol-3-phosphate transport system substrate-binding protein
VRSAAKNIAERFMQLHPNVKIEWVYTRPTNADSIQWLTTQIAGGTVPALIPANLGDSYREWFYDVTDILDTPNEYIPGNSRWKDIYPDYIWSSKLFDINNRIISIPVYTYPTPNVGIFYNKDLFASLNLQPPLSWEELRSVGKALKAAGYGVFAPSVKNISTDNWMYIIAIGPGYMKAIFNEIDYDHDGNISSVEYIRAAKADYFNPVTKEYAREILYFTKELINDYYVPGFETADLEAMWNQGRVAMKWAGAWSMPGENSNTRRGFQFGVAPFPVVSSASSKYVTDIEFSDGPRVVTSIGMDVMRAAVDTNPGMLEAAIAYMKYFTASENLSEWVLEDGYILGATKDCLVPPSILSWSDRKFAVIPNNFWPTGLGDAEAESSLGRELEMWVKGQTNDNTFFTRWNQIQQAGADRLIRANNINTQGW